MREQKRFNCKNAGEVIMLTRQLLHPVSGVGDDEPHTQYDYGCSAENECSMFYSEGCKVRLLREKN